MFPGLELSLAVDRQSGSGAEHIIGPGVELVRSECAGTEIRDAGLIDQHVDLFEVIDSIPNVQCTQRVAHHLRIPLRRHRNTLSILEVDDRYLFLTHSMTIGLALIVFAVYAAIAKIKKSAERTTALDETQPVSAENSESVTVLGQLKPFFKPKAILLCISLGVVMSAGTLFLLLAARSVPASVQYPVVSGGVIVLSALTSVVVFKDKLSIREIIAIAGAFVSTVLFAF